MTLGGSERRRPSRLGSPVTVTVLGFVVAVGVLVLLITVVEASVAERDRADETVAVSSVVDPAIDALTDLQAERGLSRVYTVTRNPDDRETYVAAIADTDGSITRLRLEWTRHGSVLADLGPATMGDVFQSLSALDDLRTAVLSGGGDEAPEEAYASLVDMLREGILAVDAAATDEQFVPARRALSSLIRAMASLARERALVAGVLASEEPLTRDEEIQLSLIEREVRASLRAARTLLPADQAEQVGEIASGDVARGADGLLAWIEGRSDTGDYQLDPAFWFREATDRIDAVGDLARELNGDIQESAAEARADAGRDLFLRAAGLGGLFLIALAAAAAAVTASRERVRALTEYEQLAEGFTNWFLPENFPKVPDIAVAARYVPSSVRTRSGGDWYDLYVADAERLVIVIGDVAGHGPRAGAHMAQLRNLLRGLSMDDAGAPEDWLQRLEDSLDGKDVLATVFLATLDVSAGRLVYTRAGHLPGLVRAPDGSIEVLDGGHGPPVGSGVDFDRAHRAADLLPGSVIVLYTDGLVEKRTADTAEAVWQLAAVISDTTPTVDLEKMADQVLEARGQAADDDIAVLVVGWRLPEAGGPGAG